MTLTIAIKIMRMSAKALTKKFGSRAVGLSKRIKAGDVINKAKKGKLASKRSAEINRKGGMSNRDRMERDWNRDDDAVRYRGKHGDLGD